LGFSEQQQQQRTDSAFAGHPAMMNLRHLAIIPRGILILP
jgi:hypothetical protein